MMKKLIFITLMFTSILNAQTFKFNDDGTTDYVVYTIDKAKASELHTKTLNWVNTTYKNPDAVIKAKIENEMIRLEGFEQSAFSRTFKSGNKAEYDVHYILTLEFQDGKYRVKYQHEKITVDESQVHFNLTDVLNNIQDKNGNGWEGAREQYELKVNGLFNSLKDYITSENGGW